jgi:amino-acid N-acetyltransferase
MSVAMLHAPVREPERGTRDSSVATRDAGDGARHIGADRAEPFELRAATAAHARAIHALIVDHLAEGHLLAREIGEITVHAHRFVVAVQDDRVVACAELAPLSRDVSEVRSFVVSRAARGQRVGGRMIADLVSRGQNEGFDRLCAFTHAPGYFVRLGFSIVPHVWLPEKIETTCRSCAQFRRCGQYAVVKSLRRARQGRVPLAALHA